MVTCCRVIERYLTCLIGGAQLATMTFLAPTSFAIWTISFEVVPRTIESPKSSGRAISGQQPYEPTIDNQNILVSKFQRHSIELFADILLPHLLTRHDERPPNIAILDKTFAIWQFEFLGEIQSRNTRRIRNLRRVSK